MDRWPKIGYDLQNTSRAPNVSAPTGETSECWRHDLTSGLYTSPVVADSTIYINYESEYFGDEPNVYALDAETGNVLWTADLGRFGNFWSSPTVANGTLYVLDGSGAHSGNLLALDCSDGSKLWQAVGSFNHSAVVSNGVVYVGSDRGLTALDATTGDVEWYRNIEAKAEATPAIDDRTLFVPQGGHLRAVNAETGELQWETATGTRQTSPVVAAGKVFTGGEDGVLRAFDTDGGSIEWTCEVGDQIYEPPAATKRRVYFGSDDGHLYAVTTESGERQWQVALDEWVREITYLGESLYVCSWTKGSREDGGVYVLSPEDGSLCQIIEFESSPHTPVIAADGRLFVGTAKNLVALSD